MTQRRIKHDKSIHPKIKYQYESFPYMKKTCQPIKNDSSSQYYAKIDDVIYPKSLPLYQNNSVNFACLNSNKRMKTILLWNTYFANNFSEYGLGKIEPFKKMSCPVVNCELTMDRSRLNDSDYVVVHMMPNRDPFDPIPAYRPLKQRWIFLLYESPAIFAYHDYSKYDSLFNLTATYRITSDIYSIYYPLARMKWAKNPAFVQDWDYLTGKTKMAVALISNCQTKGRKDYIKSLRKYIEVDIYGRCGKPCPDSLAECRSYLASEYKFFLSFENSFCEDYITEKFFETLQYDIIPVVMGSGPYDHYVSTLSRLYVI